MSLNLNQDLVEENKELATRLAVLADAVRNLLTTHSICSMRTPSMVERKVEALSERYSTVMNDQLWQEFKEVTNFFNDPEIIRWILSLQETDAELVSRMRQWLDRENIVGRHVTNGNDVRPIIYVYTKTDVVSDYDSPPKFNTREVWALGPTLSKQGFASQATLLECNPKNWKLVEEIK